MKATLVSLVFLAGVSPWLTRSAEPAPAVALRLERDAGTILLNYQVSEPRGMVTVHAGDSLADLAHQPFPGPSEPVGPTAAGTLSLGSVGTGSTARFYAMIWERGATNPAPARLAWVPPGTCWLGSPVDEKERESDEPVSRLITLTHGLFMGRFEVTQAEYNGLMSTNPSAFTGDLTRPVEQVTWQEASDYCAALNAHAQAAGQLPPGYAYRLPTEAEWEYAARAGTIQRFSHGDDPTYAGLAEYAWFASNAAASTHPVGLKPANDWGVHDLYGNVAEWCADWYQPGADLRRVDPPGPQAGAWRVTRGGSYVDGGRYCRSAARGADWPAHRFSDVGFRVVLAAAPGLPDEVPAPEVSVIPAGVFVLGSALDEPGRQADEAPLTQVTFSEDFAMSRREITQREFGAVMGVNPSWYRGWADLPVEQVSWSDAVNFCTRLTAREQAAGRLAPGLVYRLPTEAEWEYAARAGTQSAYGYGDDPTGAGLQESAWYLRSAGFSTGVAGQLQPNAWGLEDMHGNVAEWCHDRYGAYPGGAVTDPVGPPVGSARVVRGGSFANDFPACRSASRQSAAPTTLSARVGFRIVRARPLPTLTH